MFFFNIYKIFSLGWLSFVRVARITNCIITLRLCYVLYGQVYESVCLPLMSATSGTSFCVSSGSVLLLSVEYVNVNSGLSTVFCCAPCIIQRLLFLLCIWLCCLLRWWLEQDVPSFLTNLLFLLIVYLNQSPIAVIGLL